MSDVLKKVLIVVTTDPRESGRPSEAVRIAAGIGGWEKVTVQLCLGGEAWRMLDETTDELVNGEVFESYLPLLREGETRVYVLKADSGTSVTSVPEISTSELAALGRSVDIVLRF